MTTTIVYKHGRNIIHRGDPKIMKMVKELKLKGLTIVVQMSEAARKNASKGGGWYRAGYFDARKNLIQVIGYGQTPKEIMRVVAHELGHAHHYQHKYADFKKCTHMAREEYAHRVQAELGYPTSGFNRAYYERRDRRKC